MRRLLHALLLAFLLLFTSAHYLSPQPIERCLSSMFASISHVMRNDNRSPEQQLVQRQPSFFCASRKYFEHEEIPTE